MMSRATKDSETSGIRALIADPADIGTGISLCWLHIRILFLGATALCSSPLLVHAQTSKPLAVEDALKMRIFTEHYAVAPSPDGKFVAYAARPAAREGRVTEPYPQTGVPESAQRASIFVVDIETGAEKNVTSDVGDNWHPAWSPDSRYVAFLSDRDGNNQARLWVWDSATKRCRRVSESNVRGDEIAWTPDGKNILALIVPFDLPLDRYLAHFNLSSSEPTSKSYELSTVTLFHSGPANADTVESSPWTLDWALRDLVSINVETATLTVIVHGQHVAHYAVSADGSQLVYSNAKRFEKPGSQETLFDIVAVDLTTQASMSIASDVAMGLAGEDFAWSPRGRRIVYHGRDRAGSSFVFVDLGSEKPRPVGVISFDRQAERGLSNVPFWAGEGDDVYFLKQGAIWKATIGAGDPREVARITGRRIAQLIATNNRRLWMSEQGAKTVVLTRDDTNSADAFYEVNLLTGETGRLLQDGNCFSCAIQDVQAKPVNEGPGILFYSENVDRPSDLWIADADFQSRRRVTHLNPRFDEYRLGRVRLIDWLSDDGERLRGAVLLPADYAEGKRYPLITWVYGSRLLSDHFDHFGLAYFGAFNLQLFATRGYAVLLPDSPQHEGTSMLDLAKTVLPGVSKLVEIGIADPTRLGIMGHSNGGYSVLGLIVQTTRFKAAIDLDGMSDFIGGYTEMNGSGGAFGTSLLEHGQNGMGGTLWQYRERYIENSPLFYFDRVETPVLIVQGGADVAVAPFLGDAAFVALRRLGKEVSYAKYAGENHSPLYWSFANQADLCNRMLEWFNRHLEK